MARAGAAGNGEGCYTAAASASSGNGVESGGLPVFDLIEQNDAIGHQRRRMGEERLQLLARGDEFDVDVHVLGSRFPGGRS